MNFLVFDVGGFAIKYAVMNDKTDFIEKGKIPTPLDSLGSFLSAIEVVYNRFKDRITGIALSLPGRIDSDHGYSYMGGSLKYNDCKEIVSLLQVNCPLPITIENDSKCAALAEAWMGSLSDCRDGIVITLGTAVGGGIIINRKLYKGPHFQAGEFSHIIVDHDVNDDDDPLFWRCYGGAKGLSRMVARAKNLPFEKVTGRTVFEYASQGDVEVLQILDEYCRKLVIQLINLHLIFDPERIAIGGGISSQDILFKYIYKNADIYAKYIPDGFVRPEIVRCKFGNDSNLIGALYCFLNRQGYLDHNNGIL